MHQDPLRSTRKRPIISFGHSWVVFSLHVSFPFALGKIWALPNFFTLSQKDNIETGTRTQWNAGKETTR
jgi:hypothetical protein